MPGRHAAPKPRKRWLRRAQALLAITAGVAGASVLGVVGGSGTLALWSDSHTLAIPDVTSGSAGLQIDGELPPVHDLLPGEAVAVSVTVENVGSVPLDVRPTASIAAHSGTGGYEIRAALIYTGTACTPALLAGYDPLGASWDAEANVLHTVIQPHAAGGANDLQLCVSVTAGSDVHPDDTIQYAVHLDGEQVVAAAP